MNAIKLAIMKQLKLAIYNSNNATGITKKSVVDLPLSRQTFEIMFVSKLPVLNLKSKSAVSCNLSIKQLDTIFGPNWSIYNQLNSTTQQRIIEDVSLLYRIKTMQGIR